MPNASRRLDLRPRLLDKIEVGHDGGCWLYTGVINGSGYGRFMGVLAHRITYEHFIGRIPDGLDIDHLCRVRRCVNPWHMEPVTNYENWRRGISPSALNAQRTHCKRGHEFTPENTMPAGGRKGGRRCRACAKAYTMRAFDPARHEHGRRGYTHGCRCAVCVDEYRVYARAMKARQRAREAAAGCAEDTWLDRLEEVVMQARPAPC